MILANVQKPGPLPACVGVVAGLFTAAASPCG